MAEARSERDRRCWGFVSAFPAPAVCMVAKQAEEQGLEGVFAPQVMGPPWVPLAAAAAVTERLKLASAAAVTERLKLASGIAIAAGGPGGFPCGMLNGFLTVAVRNRALPAPDKNRFQQVWPGSLPSLP